MATFKQVIACNIAKMGHKAGWCLNNVKSAYGITTPGTSARVQLNAEKAAGRFHTGPAPTNVAVPVFLNTKSTYGHVMISYFGVIYSDGVRANISQAKLAGWSEGLCGHIIVKAETAPAPAKKTNEQIADEVIAGKWGNGEDRKNRLKAAGYDYNAIQAIVNQKCAKPTPAPAPAPAPLKAGDAVRITRWVDYNGKALRQMAGDFRIMQLNGKRAVVTRNGGIYAAISTDNLARA